MGCGCKQIRKKLLSEIGARRFRAAAKTAMIGTKQIARNLRAPKIASRRRGRA